MRFYYFGVRRGGKRVIFGDTYREPNQAAMISTETEFDIHDDAGFRKVLALLPVPERGEGWDEVHRLNLPGLVERLSPRPEDVSRAGAAQHPIEAALAIVGGVVRYDLIAKWVVQGRLSGELEELPLDARVNSAITDISQVLHWQHLRSDTKQRLEALATERPRLEQIRFWEAPRLKQQLAPRKVQLSNLDPADGPYGTIQLEISRIESKLKAMDTGLGDLDAEMAALNTRLRDLDVAGKERDYTRYLARVNKLHNRICSAFQ